MHHLYFITPHPHRSQQLLHSTREQLKYHESDITRRSMGVQSTIADFLDGPPGAAGNNRKLVRNLLLFGVAVAVLYNWETVIGDFDEPPAAS